MAYGTRIYNKPSTTRTDLLITRKAAKAKSTPDEWRKAKKKYRFIPVNDRAQQRWVDKSVKAKGQHTNTPKARGRTIIRGGTIMMGVGRAIPIMAVGWIATDATMRVMEGEPIQGQPITSELKHRWYQVNQNTITGLNTAISIAPVAYGVSKTLLAVAL